MKHRSVIRNHNHFIMFDDVHRGWSIYTGQWLLIDGPWFEFLDSKGTVNVSLRPYKAMPRYYPDDDEECQEPSSEGSLFWDKLVIPYNVAVKRFYPKDYEDLSKITRHYEGYKKFAYFNPLNHYLFKRTKITVWRCNGGELPAYLRNMDWGEDLEELFTLIYHPMEGTHVTTTV